MALIDAAAATLVVLLLLAAASSAPVAVEGRQTAAVEGCSGVPLVCAEAMSDYYPNLVDQCCNSLLLSDNGCQGNHCLQCKLQEEFSGWGDLGQIFPCISKEADCQQQS